MKPSEIFEGENSSLKKTFDEAVAHEPMTSTEIMLENTIVTEMAYLWSAIEENLPKSQEMEALGQEKILRAVKAGYLKCRPIFINQALAEERERERVERKIKQAWNYPCNCDRKNILCIHDFSQMKVALSSLDPLQIKNKYDE